MDLLISLEAAPLEVLVLEDLVQAKFPIFEPLFPDLVALTLVSRQNRTNIRTNFPVAPFFVGLCVMSAGTS